MKLHDLKPNKGSRRNRKRLGRGMGSGQGKTAGRGEKGQKSRAGYSRSLGFEGGQMPLHRRIPKRGFTNVHRLEVEAVNLFRLAAVPPGVEVTPEYMLKAGLVSPRAERVKILGVGELTTALIIKAHRFSKSAAAKIEAAGGKAEIIPVRAKGVQRQPSQRQMKRAAAGKSAPTSGDAS